MTTAPQASALPLFYSKPVPLDKNRHAGLRIKEKTDFAFAAQANSVPVVASEFAQLTRFMPVVFSAQDPCVPIAILGLRQQGNLFINDAGQWKPGTYIPAYIRRYPFMLVKGPEERLILCVDEENSLLSEGGTGPALFEAGEATEAAKKALEFTAAFQRELEQVMAFGKAVSDQGLLEAQTANVTLSKTGEQLTLSGFRVINEEKFRALPEAVVADWFKKGWLDLIALHLAARNNWGGLIDLLAEREGPAAPPVKLH